MFSIIVPVLGLSLLGVAGIASAHGISGGVGNITPDEIVARHEAMFAEQAQILGISVDEVKSGWAQGKTLFDIAKEKGVSEETLQSKMKDARLLQMKSSLQTLVEKGVITQAQADQRLTFMEQNVGKGQKQAFGGHRMRGRMMF